MYKQADLEIQTKVSNNKALKGRCFEGDIKYSNLIFHNWGMTGTCYYKVVSNHSDDEKCVECLVFSKKPIIRFQPRSHLHHHPGDRVLGIYDFQGFFSQPVYVEDLMKMKEIGADAYNSAAYEFLQELLAADWNESVRMRGNHAACI